MDYLSLLPTSAKCDEIVALRQKRLEWATQDKKGFLRYRKPCERLASFAARHIDCTGDTVTIGKEGEISDAERNIIREDLRAFMPWRKGPFSIFGIDVDAEWRSERKWQRVLPVLPDLKDKVIADIGCNNGYYMFRMSPFQPRLVLGLEPTIQHYYCFNGLNGMAGLSNLHIDLLGVEHLSLFPACFDVIFLMGIIYHRPSPLDVLRDIHTALRPGGTLILESQAIPGAEPLALFPEKTYAKVPGTYFVPTGTCLHNWMQRAGFTDVEIFCNHPMSSAEQRRTEWMPFESYSDFLKPGEPSLTVEGYPAPHRVFLRGRKGIAALRESHCQHR
jgi:tRNA (mo5U34)-methyltransferase